MAEDKHRDICKAVEEGKHRDVCKAVEEDKNADNCSVLELKSFPKKKPNMEIKCQM